MGDPYNPFDPGDERHAAWDRLARRSRARTPAEFRAASEQRRADWETVGQPCWPAPGDERAWRRRLGVLRRRGEDGPERRRLEADVACAAGMRARRATLPWL